MVWSGQIIGVNHLPTLDPNTPFLRRKLPIIYPPVPGLNSVLGFWLAGDRGTFTLWDGSGSTAPNRRGDPGRLPIRRLRANHEEAHQGRPRVLSGKSHLQHSPHN